MDNAEMNRREHEGLFHHARWWAIAFLTSVLAAKTLAVVFGMDTDETRWFKYLIGLPVIIGFLAMLIAMFHRRWDCTVCRLKGVLQIDSAEMAKRKKFRRRFRMFHRFIEPIDRLGGKIGRRFFTKSKHAPAIGFILVWGTGFVIIQVGLSFLPEIIDTTIFYAANGMLFWVLRAHFCLGRFCPFCRGRGDDDDDDPHGGPDGPDGDGIEIPKNIATIDTSIVENTKSAPR